MRRRTSARRTVRARNVHLSFVLHCKNLSIRNCVCAFTIIIIINVLFITLTCNAGTWNGVIESSCQIYCCHGRVALSKAYNYYQLREISWHQATQDGRTPDGACKERPSILCFILEASIYFFIASVYQCFVLQASIYTQVLYHYYFYQATQDGRTPDGACKERPSILHFVRQASIHPQLCVRKASIYPQASIYA